MVRLLLVSTLTTVFIGCAGSRPAPEPTRRHGCVNVDVADNSVDVQVRPGCEDGNVDVHVNWP